MPISSLIKHFFSHLFLLFLLVISNRVWSAGESLFRIQGFDFQVQIKSTDPDQSPLEKTLHLSRKNGKTFHHLLSHTLYYEDSDCNSIMLELGDYDIQGNQMVFYSYWANMGDAPASYYGVRKQVYEVSPKGRVRLKDSVLHIISGPRTEENQASGHGVDFLELNTQEKDLEQNLALKKYVRLIEKKFGGRFVFSNAADSLMKEVKTRLGPEIQKRTAHWQSDTFGVRK
jgi:hypothetical protein